ncbi:TniQ family protein [Agarivorans gilvus]|uniref:TniQ family protein n=1 Tax=Agarivorans gilvus TaxID=680279 RepID=UPI0006EC2638|nr:TniQ family protein [Agarivorans gilvus]
MFLIPEDYHEDESLESYLLRISQANGFESYALLSGAVKEFLRQHDAEAYGAFPLELSLVNIYHAKLSSSFRVRAIRLMEELIGLSTWQLNRLALKHTAQTIVGSYTILVRQKEFLPRAFLRQGSVPVCPQCLSVQPYIRQNWHFLPCTACNLHQTKLLCHCPECGEALNYQKTELIEYCQCGYDLRSVRTNVASKAECQLSAIFDKSREASNNPLLVCRHTSIRTGALLWYCLWRNVELDELVVDKNHAQDCIGFFERWPDEINKELAAIAEAAEQRLVEPFNKTAFSAVFGGLLNRSRVAPLSMSSEDFIHQSVIQFLVHLVMDNPKSKQPNIADLQLTVPEVAALLNCSREQVYRYYEEGMLELTFRLRLHNTLSLNKPAFFLRQAVELAISLTSGSGDPLPAW